jgi:predicted ester cyclase
VSSGDLIAARCVIKATHTGETLGFAVARKPVHITGMVFVRIKNGQIIEAWNNFDFLGLYQQLGVPPPDPSSSSVH